MSKILICAVCCWVILLFSVIVQTVDCSIVNNVDRKKRCGVKDLSDAEFGMRKSQDEALGAKILGHAHRTLSHSNRTTDKHHKHTTPAWSVDGGRILTHVHVIFDPDTQSGFITNDQMTQQLELLSTAFAPGKWKFNIKTLHYIANSSWTGLALGSTEELEMFAALRVGKAHSLNVFFTPNYEYLGVSSFPSDFKTEKLLDGVVIESNTVPGGAYFPYNEGKTLVHEVGHWMGLYHTFRGGCGADGDGVWDTPAEAEPNYDCVPRDSCVTIPGSDPIHNYMDYSDDTCMIQFTSGQFNRMQEQFNLYRSDNPFLAHWDGDSVGIGSTSVSFSNGLAALRETYHI